MDDLPRDVIFKIGLSMDLPELVAYCQTSSKHNDITCNNNSFWDNKLRQDYGLKMKGTDLKGAYQKTKNLIYKRMASIDLSKPNSEIYIEKTMRALTIVYTLSTDYGEVLSKIEDTEVYKYLFQHYGEPAVKNGSVDEQGVHQHTEFIVMLNRLSQYVELVNNLTEMGFEHNQ